MVTVLTVSGGSIVVGTGEKQLPQQSYCCQCPLGCSAGERDGDMGVRQTTGGRERSKERDPDASEKER